MKHFLVERDRTGLRKITVYEDGGEAYEAFTERERELYPWRSGFSTSQHPEVVLLGADSLSACIATHSAWFDEAADPMDLLRASEPPSCPRSANRARTGWCDQDEDVQPALKGEQPVGHRASRTLPNRRTFT